MFNDLSDILEGYDDKNDDTILIKIIKINIEKYRIIS